MAGMPDLNRSTGKPRPARASSRNVSPPVFSCCMGTGMGLIPSPTFPSDQIDVKWISFHNHGQMVREVDKNPDF